MATTTLIKQEDKTEEATGITSTELARKGHLAAKRFLERRGIEILAEDWTCKKDKADFVALDEDDLCIITLKVEINEGDGMSDEKDYDRKAFERLAMCFLAENQDMEESPVRGDLITMCVIGEHKAFLRYHRGITQDCK